MENVWATDKFTGGRLTDARSIENFRAQLQRKADRLGARMHGYNHQRGIWQIEVLNFGA